MSSDARKMLLNVYKHMSTLDGAGIVLLLTLIEKFKQQPFNPHTVQWVVGWLAISLIGAVICMWGLVAWEIFGVKDPMPMKYRAAFGFAHAAALLGFFFGIGNLIYLAWQGTR